MSDKPTTPPRWHHFLDAQIKNRPDALALTDSIGTSWDYAGLDRACEAVKEILQSAGVKTGDRVLIVAENCAAAVAALFACSRLGAVAVPTNARQTNAEVARILDHARPAAVLLTSEVSKDAASHGARMKAQGITGAFGTLLLATPYASNPDSDRDVAVLLYTTGTTGTPKGVMLTHGNLVFGGRSSVAIRGMTQADVIYGILPLTHVFGLSSIVTAAMCAGALIRFEARFSPERLYRALGDGVTLLSAVPQIHALLMQYTREQGLEILQNSALRYVSSGAAPLDPEWKRKAEAFYGVALQNGYGMTETTAGICVTQSALGDPDVSVGPPLPGVEVAIKQPDGDGIGEVLTRGPNVMKGYYRNPGETEKVLDCDGWMHTGDLGRIDKAGFLHIMGRLKELIIHGGFNVFPPEVEAALNAHPQVIQSAVIGRKVDGDEQVLGFVQVAVGDAPDPEQLRQFVAGQLAGYKRPAQIIMATDLPAAPTGKILRHRLLEVFDRQLT
ncbi:MAG: acyl--CoA ligase [Rhodobacteraceae bacterium]|nr:acyl--CoA ligase [Paracoccaceae bacterium]